MTLETRKERRSKKKMMTIETEDREQEEREKRHGFFFFFPVRVSVSVALSTVVSVLFVFSFLFSCYSLYLMDLPLTLVEDRFGTPCSNLLAEINLAVCQLLGFANHDFALIQVSLQHCLAVSLR